MFLTGSLAATALAPPPSPEFGYDATGPSTVVAKTPLCASVPDPDPDPDLVPVSACPCLSDDVEGCRPRRSCFLGYLIGVRRRVPNRH